MTNPTAGRLHLAGVLLFGLGAAAVGLAGFSTGTRSQWRLVTALSQTPIGDGRLFRSMEGFPDADQYRKALVDSSIELLKPPGSTLHLRIQSLIELGSGDLRAAGESLHRLLEIQPDDPETLNDLGVVYMALGKESALNYFKAAQFFERSRSLAPHAPAPNLNAAAVYRKLQLDELADRRRREYLSVEGPDEIPKIDDSESALMNSMHQALMNKNMDAANQLLTASIPSFRRAALNRVLNPGDGRALDDTVKFVLDYFTNARNDLTIAAILTPLAGKDRERVINARKLVSDGIEFYRHGKQEEASRSYDLAETALAGTNSPFDDLWIKLNRADTYIRKRNMQDDAQSLLAMVVSESRKRQYTWLLGMALTSRNADQRLARDNEEQLRTLNEAVDMLVALGAQQEAARALNYLAGAYLLAGDLEKSLDIAYRTLFFTPKSDHIRRTQLFTLVGTEVYRLGMQDYARALGQRALDEARETNNPGLVSYASSNLAMLHELSGNIPSATYYFEIARTSSNQIESAGDREINEMTINLLCARIRTDRGEYSEAEKCLRQNREIFRHLRVRIPYFSAQTLLQSAETHALDHQFDQARQDFQEAAGVVENDDAYLAGGLRMAFENERRILYEKAIAFEYDHGSQDKAWEYTQRYRSKLFLEFLGQLDPGINAIRGVAIDRNRIQQRLPPNAQVIEYVVLKDRVLIWLVSNKTFISAYVPVSRAELERRISDLLRRIQDKGDFQQQAQDLHRLLIEPIENKLDPGSAVAIIPDQALHRLNFSALYSKSKRSYLVERYTILENPSLTSLFSGGATNPSRSNAVAFGAQTDDTNATAELASLQEYYSGIPTFNGAAALKTAFLTSLESAGMFHFAGHSQDASDPLRSAILLDGKTEGPNSVTAIDITKHRMPPNSVVVLASCDSSVGNSRDGVGIRGLTSAFLISGAGSVVGSLWLVESENTSRLVLAFHKAFAQDKLPVAEALRKAQVKLIAEGRHPYYWSGFVVTGNTSALR